MSKWGMYPPLIVKALEELGPSTRHELCVHMGLTRQFLAGILHRMVRDTPLKGKRLHISGYTYDAEGSRRYPRAIYAIGDKPNATKPVSDQRENRRRSRVNVSLKYRTNSVFNLGLTRKQLEEMRKAA